MCFKCFCIYISLVYKIAKFTLFGGNPEHYYVNNVSFDLIYLNLTLYTFPQNLSIVGLLIELSQKSSHDIFYSENASNLMLI